MATNELMTIPKTVAELAYYLYVSPEAITTKLRRMDRPTGENLTEEDLADLVREYRRRAGKRSEETLGAAAALADLLGLPQEEDAGPADKTVKPPRKKEPGNKQPPADAPKPPEEASATEGVAKDIGIIDKVFRSRVMLFSVFLAGIVWQIKHTAVVVARADDPEIVGASIQDYLYALAIQFTALLLTIHKGGKGYLIAFGVFEYFVNMVYYRPWGNDANWDVWIQTNLLSMGIAFTLYSYSELFAAKK